MEMMKIHVFRQSFRTIVSIVVGVTMLLRQIDDVTCHGRLWEPPSRSSMWRLGYNTTININDNELSCGGFTNQWIAYGGLCGVCGDPYQQEPRDNEYGGKYASGFITRIYPIGRIIDVVVGLTANHEGYFEFRICPIHYPTIAETQACMERHPLRIVNGDDNGSKFYIKDPTLEGDVRLQLELPPNLSCQHCVLRWRYRTGTRWGCDPDKTCGSGKGPQEEFYGCSDVSIADVTSVVYNDPVIHPEHAEDGLNDLGSAPTHDTVVSNSIQSPLHGNKGHYTMYSDKKHEAYSQYVKTVTVKQESAPSPMKFSNFRKFLENITLSALKNYYEQNWGHTPSRCTPTTRFRRNPIVQEYCRKVCSYNSADCPRNMCVCEIQIIVATPPSKIVKSLSRKNRPKIDTNHLRRFVRRLIVENKLMYGNQPLVSSNTEAVELVEPVSKQTSRDQLVVQPEHYIDYKKYKNENIVTKDISKGVNYDPDKTQTNHGRVLPKTMNCKASDNFSHNPYMTKWCNTNCPFGFCPQRVCSCS